MSLFNDAATLAKNIETTVQNAILKAEQGVAEDVNIVATAANEARNEVEQGIDWLMTEGPVFGQALESFLGKFGQLAIAAGEDAQQFLEAGASLVSTLKTIAS
jgi:hypothetical protein